jgi:membrane-associated phospholipid phosphatase
MIGRYAALALCLAAVPVGAQEAPPAPSGSQVDDFRHLPGLLWDDTRTLAQAPGAWSSRQWGEAGLGAFAVLATGLALDHAVDDAVVRSDHPSLRNAARNVAQLGGVGGLVLIGAGYLGSSWLGQDEARAMWTDTGIATILARATAFTVQVAVGRATPSAGQGAHDFRPISSQDSFPSGHAAQAFAMASAISMHSDSPWAGGIAYGLAGLVGLSRLETRDHYTSDVLAGALVGTTIGRAVVRVNQGRRRGAGPSAEISVMPAWSRDFRGICVAAKF